MALRGFGKVSGLRVGLSGGAAIVFNIGNINGSAVLRTVSLLCTSVVTGLVKAMEDGATEFGRSFVDCKGSTTNVGTSFSFKSNRDVCCRHAVSETGNRGEGADTLGGLASGFRSLCVRVNCSSNGNG